MKIPFISIPRHLPMHVLSAMCIGFGCAYPLSIAMNLFTSWRLCAMVCVCTSLFFALLDCIPKLRTLAHLLLFVLFASFVYQHKEHTQAIGAALTLFLNGLPLSLAAYSRIITILLSFLMTSIGVSFSQSSNAFFPLALLTLIELIVISFLGIDIPAVSFLPLALALLISARVHGTGSLSVIPASAMVLLLSFLLLPLAGSAVPALSDYAERTRKKIDDYFFFSDPRSAFSLSSVGWQPYGPDRLGGPVNPTNDPVMQVKTSERALLRGTVKNNYTGLSWTDSISSSRYLYVNPRFISLRKNLFDISRPDRSLRETLPDSQLITVTMSSESASTLYLTQRFSAPKGRDIVPYFSPASEVFATRSLLPGDHYTFSGKLMTASSEGIRDAVLASHDLSDPYYKTVFSTYTQLPDSVDSRVYALAQQLTRDAANDYDRAAALCAYLQTSFPYTMNQSVPPANRDFVSWFLFEEQQGYCTSFASSMCVLARAVGLPSRYIEGYAAIPDADGIARVTQQYAHAWSEVYFPGFGWLTFDPTPGSGSSSDGTGSELPDSSSEEKQPDSDNPTPPPTESEVPSQTNHTPYPSPSSVATPTPSPLPTPTPSPTPVHHDPRVTPTPRITPAPTPVPTSTPSPVPPSPHGDDSSFPPWSLILVLLFVLVAALITVRFILVSPSYRASHAHHPSEALLIWYDAVCDVLYCLGIVPKTSEAPATFLTRAQQISHVHVDLGSLVRAVCVARYSSHKLKHAQILKAEKIYYSLYSALSVPQKLQLLRLRFRLGGIRRP